jgi:regulator of nucleoside diphosphate kinase
VSSTFGEEFEMNLHTAGPERPPIHVLAQESDLVASLALTVEHRQPVVAAMLLEEIERAELHDPNTIPADAVRIGSAISFIDERTGHTRNVQLVMPVDADIEQGRISILTPVGAALYGLRAGDAIDWPDLDGKERRITIVGVTQPAATKPN